MFIVLSLQGKCKVNAVWQARLANAEPQPSLVLASSWLRVQRYNFFSSFLNLSHFYPHFIWNMLYVSCWFSTKYLFFVMPLSTIYYANALRTSCRCLALYKRRHPHRSCGLSASTTQGIPITRATYLYNESIKNSCERITYHVPFPIFNNLSHPSWHIISIIYNIYIIYNRI